MNKEKTKGASTGLTLQHKIGYIQGMQFPQEAE